MTLEGFSTQQFDKVIEDARSQMNKIERPDVKDELSKMVSRLTDMKVALAELKHLDDEFHRGNIITEIYLDRHKKLVKDFYLARDGITDEILPKIANLEVSNEQKSRLSKFKDYLKSNKDFLLNVSQLILTLVQIFGKPS